MQLSAASVRLLCEEAVPAALSDWCDTANAMYGLTLDQQRRRFCAQATCASPSCAVWDLENSCNGRSISFIIGVDAYGERYHFDGSGQLVGVEVQRSASICSQDVFGTACELVESSFADCGDVPDAGV
jgi:hypothetical protein